MIKSHTLKNGTLAGAALAPLALALAMGAAPAMAQDAAVAPSVSSTPTSDKSDDKVIVVTGSRIQRSDLSSSAPVSVVSQEEFKLRGAVNVETVLNELPSVVPGFTAFSNNPGNGVATLNLRNLGPTRTLVLVNGRRYMFYDTTQVVDLNTIPSFLIDSVDVETGGASAVYGSDAIAGVVNFKLKNVQGIEAGTQYGITQRGDGMRWDSHLAIGGEIADGKGHVTVYGEYYKRKPIYQADRGFSYYTLTDDGDGGFDHGGSATGANGRFYTSSKYGAGTDYTGLGATFDSPGAASRAFQSPADLYNYAPANYLMLPQKRWIVGGYADYEISDAATAYTEVTFTNNKVVESLAPTPVTGTFTFNLANQAQYLSAADYAALQTISGRQVADGTAAAGTVNLSVARRVNEVGNRVNFDERNAFRALGGLRGDITNTIHYDAYYSYARTRNSEIQSGNVSSSALQAGLLDGTVNLFGPGTLDQTAVDEISILAQNQDISVLQVASASINGTLFNLGTGADDVGFALGGEYRKVHSRFVPDTALSSGDVIGFNAGDATEGGYNVKEIFAELDVPILAHKPFFEKLELHGAGRYSDYSLSGVGNVWTYAGDVKWAPVKDVMFRAQYQHAVRAPNVGELYGGLSQGFPAATDPCATAAALGSGALHDTCVATGVPAAALVKDADNSTLQPNQQIQSVFGGNPKLSAEKSNSYTFGVVLSPSFVPRLHVTVDYFNIKVKDAISTLGGGVNNILDACYNVLHDASSIFCQAIKRNPATGEIDGSTGADGTQYVVSDLNANVSSFKTSGIDLQADYTQPLNFGLLSSSAKLKLSFMGTWTKEDTTIINLGTSLETIKCAGRFGLNCGDPHAKFKTNTRLSYVDGGLTLSFAWHYLGHVRDDDDSTLYTVEKIKAYNTFDLAASFDVSDNYTLTFGMNNMFDKKPPLMGDNQQQANTYPSTYDVLGRDFFISAGVKF